MKLVIIIIFLLFGLIYAIIRFVRGVKNKFSSQNLAKRAIEDPAYAADVVDSLEFKYGAIPFESHLAMFSKLNNLPDDLKLDEYHVRKTIKVDENRFLCITNCTIVDFGVSATGRLSDVQHYLSINFALVLNRQKSECEFFSGIYADLSEKSLKMKFKNLIEDYLNSSNK